MKAIHQFAAGFSKGDAISNEALLMRDTLRKWGYRSEIYSESARILPELRKTIRDIQLAETEIGPDDIVLLHLSIGSVVNLRFSALNCKKALLYHNITPPDQLKGLQPQSARHAEKGLQQARLLAGCATVNLADSQFNADELNNFGYSNVQVLPLMLDFSQLSRRIDRKTLQSYQDGLANILFVGRCVPNKRIEDLLAAFYYYQHFSNPNSRLIHAGSFNGTESYHAYLLTLAHENELRNTAMPGSVPQQELNAYFATASLFLCMSEHEGFCIPLLEAMEHDIPVLAYDAGAVAETMDGAGVLFHKKDYAALGEMMHQLISNQPFREQILAGQRERINRYRNRDLESELRTHLAPLLADSRP